LWPKDGTLRASFTSATVIHQWEVIPMAKPKVEIQIPKDLGLTRTQVSELQKSFEKQLVEALKGKQVASSKAKSKQMVVDVRAKSKSQIV
jgi:hypothetical protein